MVMRYLGGINSPAYNPLASNVTTGANTVQQGGVYTAASAAQASGLSQWVNDQYFDQTVTLLQADNAVNGAQNSTFIDTSGNGSTITRNGNTTQGTYGPFSVPGGYWSNAFDGAGDYLTTPSNAGFDFGTGDFTIEAWVFVLTTPASYYMIIDTRNADGFTPYTLAISSALKLETVYGNSAGQKLISAATVPLGSWAHVAVTRASGTIRLFINGALDVNTVVYSSAMNTSAIPAIGAGRAGVTSAINGYVFNGYISNLRILKGQAYYTTSFTPSSVPLEPIANTSLLTCQSNRFVDNGPLSLPLTPFGDVTPRPFTPFSSLPTYLPENNSGGFYLDGTGDYLSVTDNASLELGTSDFCFECFFYATTTAATGSILQKRSGTAVMPINIWRSNSVVQVYMSSVTNGDIVGGGTGVAIGTITTNQWYHISVYRIGTAIYGSFNGTITTLKASTSLSVLNNGNPYTLGMNGNGTTDPFTGYMSNIRLVIGSSVYTSTSAPIPTVPLTAIPNSRLLINATNANIIDPTAKNGYETAAQAQVSTAVKKYGSGSMYFDGSGDWVTTPSNPDINFGTGDFTIECWVNFSNTTATRSIAGKGVASSTGWEIYCNATPTLLIFIFGGSITYSSNYNFIVGQWYHIAVVRAGTGIGNIKMFINGFLIYESATAINTDLSTASPLYVGAGKGGASPFLGYIDDFRLTKGYARYTSTFIPPATALPRQG